MKTLPVPYLEGVRTRTARLINKPESPRHIHHEYVFSLAVEGVREFDCGHCGGTHILQPNGILLTGAHEVYAGRAQQLSQIVARATRRRPC